MSLKQIGQSGGFPNANFATKRTRPHGLFDPAFLIVGEGPRGFLRDLSILRVEHSPGQDDLIQMAIQVTLLSEARVTLVVRELAVAVRTLGAVQFLAQDFLPKLMKASRPIA
jgi:hypothetical protein